MMLQILSHTPLWVFALFAGLLALGLMQARSRNVNKLRAYVLPVGMIVLSLAGVQSSFGLKPVPVALWAAGLILVALVGYLFFRDRRVAFDPDSNAFHIPGSWCPLGVIMAIFFTKYAVAVMQALEVDAAGSQAFAMTLSLAYGGFSGYFVFRAANLVAQSVRQSTRPKPHVDPIA